MTVRAKSWYSSSKKGAILALIRGKRYNYREIARLEGVSVSTVSKYAKNIHGGNSDQSSLELNSKMRLCLKHFWKVTKQLLRKLNKIGSYVMSFCLVQQ